MASNVDSTQLQVAGNINVDKISITTTRGFYQDVTNQVIGIQIFEDLFSPFMTGSFIMKDALDMINVFPLIGEEYVELKLSTPYIDAAKLSQKFYIYKMTDREPIGDKEYVYELHFIAEEALIDINKKISKSFSGRCSDIARKILTDTEHGFQLKNVNIEETSNSTKYISNFWSPVKNMNCICDRSVNMNGSASYVFFQNRYGYNFVSLESLYALDPVQDFQYDVYIRDIKEDGRSARNATQDYKKIRKVNIPVAYDYINRSQSGMMGSKLTTYDITNKTYRTYNYDASQTFSNQKHLNKNPLTSSKSVYRYNAFMITMTKYSDSFSGFGDVTQAKSIQNRVSLMEQINSNKIEIIVPGRLDYTVGLKINVKFYKSQPTEDKDTDYIDEIFSGNYIIAAINHYVSRSAHECTMEIVKESFIKNIG